MLFVVGLDEVLDDGAGFPKGEACIWVCEGGDTSHITVSSLLSMKDDGGGAKKWKQQRHTGHWDSSTHIPASSSPGSSSGCSHMEARVPPE